jgi:caa(3)-type oxidase subunit IV
MTETSDVQQPAQTHKRPNYLLVFLGLAALTAAEVGVTYLPIPQIPLLAALATTKVVLVAMFYMHLKMDSKWYAYIFLIPLPFVVLIAGSLLIGGY